MLGLGGVVADYALRRVLAGEYPGTGAVLSRLAGAKRVPGFDLTVSAPKSVSVLFGIGDARLRGVMQAAYDQAVADAFTYAGPSQPARPRGFEPLTLRFRSRSP
ncbi:MAG: relaxase domain-containing protein [Solirubrobacteraceae bacterium]